MKGGGLPEGRPKPVDVSDIAPGAPSLEGYLFPSTYRFTRRTSANRIAREMTNHFRRVWKQIATPGADVNRTVTLASLVEKETAYPPSGRRLPRFTTTALTRA